MRFLALGILLAPLGSLASILIQDGHVLTFHPNSTPTDLQITFPIVDILIEGQRIVRISPDIKLPSSNLVKVINARGHTVSPGFVNAHHHLWQVAERATVKSKPLADMTLHEYLGYVQIGENMLWNPEDVANVESALCATLDSSVRSVFAPLKWNQSAWEDWQADQFRVLGQRLSSRNDSRVTLSFAVDIIDTEPKDIVNSAMAVVRAAGATLTTFHYAPSHDYGSITGANANYPLDSSFVVVSHCTYATQEEFDLLQRVGAGTVSTPGTEGPMAAGDSEFVRLESSVTRVGLGIDAHSISSGSMCETMRMGLQSARSIRNGNAQLYAGALGVPNRSLPKILVETVVQAARLATLRGAGQCIWRPPSDPSQGNILVALDSPDVLGVSTSDASLLSLVMFATSNDVKMVIINGELVKDQGELKRVQWYAEGGLVSSFRRQQNDLIRRLQASRISWDAHYQSALEEFGWAGSLV